jgi:flavin reductase (DIM6/NTAB) family NADH-FMN oxidoreductase RutF
LETPHLPKQPHPIVDADEFRASMRHLAGAVTVIATGIAGHRFGLTATAVCSLSDDPPTLLACVNRSASAHDLISKNRAFSINLLASDQEKVAGHFAGRAGLKGEARFEGANWQTLATGAPILAGALASFDCEVNQEHVFASHTIFIGRVVATQARDAADPLIYLRGAFRQLGPA